MGLWVAHPKASYCIGWTAFLPLTCNKQNVCTLMGKQAVDSNLMAL